MTRLIDRLQAGGANPSLLLEGIIMTMYDARTNLARQVVEEVRNHFGDIVYKTLIPRTVRLSEAPSFGKPIITHDPQGAGSIAYLDLAKEFADRICRPTRAANETHPSIEPIKEEGLFRDGAPKPLHDPQIG